jgi:hypothetical protein
VKLFGCQTIENKREVDKAYYHTEIKISVTYIGGGGGDNKISTLNILKLAYPSFIVMFLFFSAANLVVVTPLMALAKLVFPCAT